VGDFHAAGPRDILVPRAGYESAHELLADTGVHVLDGPGAPAADDDRGRALRLLAGMAVALVVAAALAWAVAELAS
jgi:hypothetical protein